MFGIGGGEFVVVAVAALAAINPKDLPKIFRTLGQWHARAQAMAAQLRHEFYTMDSEIRQGLPPSFLDLTNDGDEQDDGPPEGPPSGIEPLPQPAPTPVAQNINTPPRDEPRTNGQSCTQHS